MSASGRAAATLGVVAACLCPASPVAAHPLIDEANRRFEAADFDGAMASLARAERAELDREDLAELLFRRAVIELALGDADAMRRDIALLRALEPRRAFGRAVPPQIVAAFEAADVEPLAVAVRIDASGGGATVTATPTGGGAPLIAGVRIHTRVGEEPWRTTDGSRVEVDVGPGGRVEAYGELIGVGGGVLASDGSREQPHGLSPALALEGDGPGAGLWIGVSAAAVAVTAVLLTVALVASGGGSDATRPSPPMFVR